MENGKNIMVEAGVGIGKSYGYLFPALIASIYSGRPILIGTSSIQLSEQLVDDAHVAASYLGMKVKVTVGKGKGNFACLDRAIKSIKHTKKATKLKQWILENAVGDRGKIPFLVDDSEWEEVNVDRCIFEDCDYRHECEFYKMRSEIREGGPSDVIIVNQDLLIAHLLKRAQTSRGFIANRVPVIIIDEAHNLEEKTRKALTRMWSPKKFKNLFKRVNKLLLRHN
ncbi:DEAD/DEAH box helicase [Brevibacillus sp. 179-C7.1 HS]|uniref:DEAD/DEAH box helicase n=1 Tax=unclassified Brevibacillus TaxID=2684853 RepID=UPI00399F4113